MCAQESNSLSVIYPALFREGIFSSVVAVADWDAASPVYELRPVLLALWFLRILGRMWSLSRILKR